MPITETPSITRDRQLRRLVDLHASTEAAAALHAATLRADDRTTVLSRVLTASDEILGGADADARDQLYETVTSPAAATLVRGWMRELRGIASEWPHSGACTVATALKLWTWTVDAFRTAHREALDELTALLAPLVAARAFILDVVAGDSNANQDLCHVYAAHVSALTGAACAEIVFGYRRHLTWDAEGCATCYVSDDLDELEAFIPGFSAGARTSIDVIEADGTHPAKRGPCAKTDGLEAFTRLRNRLDTCLTGSRIAKERAVAALARRSA
jgi:hypothetical protein